MIRNDGKYIIYKIQHKQEDGRWAYSSFDYFKVTKKFSDELKEPYKSFTACGKCWQETGEFGTYNDKIAHRFLLQIATLNPNFLFRVVEVIISQKTKEIGRWLVRKES